MFKRCPECKSDKVGLLSSLQLIYCHDCCQYYPWELKADQLPLQGPARSVKVAPRK